MACGNNHVSRDYLSSQPTPVSQQVGSPGQFHAPRSVPSGKVHFFVDEHGRAAAKGTAQASQIDRERHVHVVYNADTREGSAPTGVVMIQVTDRTQPTALDHLHQTPADPEKGGHHELTVFLRPQSPERIEAEVQRAVTLLRSRARGDR